MAAGKPGSLAQSKSQTGTSREAPAPALDLPASGSELRTVREELLREFRKLGTQVQSACTEQSQNLLKEIKQEFLSMRTAPVPAWQQRRKKRGSKTDGWKQQSVRWMPEAVWKAQSGEIREGADGSTEEDGHRGKWKEEKMRLAWPVSSGEVDKDFWALPRSDNHVAPPQLPFEVPLPPPDPPQVECNGDAAAGQPGGPPHAVGGGGGAPTKRVNLGSVFSEGDDWWKDDNEADSQGCASESNSSTPSQQSLGRKSRARKLSLSLHTARRSRAIKAQEKPPLCSMSAKEVLMSSRFDNLMGIVILLNAVTIGVQTDYASRHITETFPAIYSVMERCFCGIFLLELSLRIYVHRTRFFVKWHKAVFWNYFDFLVVVAQVSEEALHLAAFTSGLDLDSFRLLRVLRVLRLVRIFRVIRVLHLISELRTIISSIMGSFRSLGWTVVLLFLMIYIVGVYFTQSITDHMVEKFADGQPMSQQDRDLRYYFGGLFRAILSLFQAMSGGADWDSMAGPLISIDVSMGIAFAAYIAFALLALMNVVTGVFVQTALQNAKDEEDAFLTDQIIKLFERCDSGGGATISLEEINKRLNDPENLGEWKSINVSPEEAHYLFELLDIEQTGEIAFEEFLSGCLRLHGNSKSMDLLTVMQECRAEFRMWQSYLTKWERFMDQHKQLSMSLTGQVGLNNQLLQEFLAGSKGTLQAAAMHKESVRQFEQKIRPIEKSFEMVRRILRSPAGLETALEAMTSSGGGAGSLEDKHWPMQSSKVDEV